MYWSIWCIHLCPSCYWRRRAAARHRKHTVFKLVEIFRIEGKRSYSLRIVVATVVRIAGTCEVETTVLAALGLEPVGTGHGAVLLLGIFLTHKDVPGCLHGSIDQLFLLCRWFSTKYYQMESGRRTTLSAKVL